MVDQSQCADSLESAALAPVPSFARVHTRPGGSTCARGKVIWSRPLTHAPDVEHGASELLREDGQDVVDTCGGGREDGLEGVFVGRLANLLREPVVVTNKIGGRDAERIQGFRVGEVKDLAQVGADLE